MRVFPKAGAEERQHKIAVARRQQQLDLENAVYGTYAKRLKAAA